MVRMLIAPSIVSGPTSDDGEIPLTNSIEL